MAQIKAVFFDAAGTLFETREPVGESYARFARANGVETSAWDVDAAFRRTFRDTPPLAFGLARKPEERGLPRALFGIDVLELEPEETSEDSRQPETTGQEG